jgi:dTMP kinase
MNPKMSQKSKPYPGFFLTIEGGDGCGKSSVATALTQRLQAEGRTVVHTREPGGTPTAEKIRALLLDPQVEVAPTAEALLFLASRAQHLHEKILPALHRGEVVICERFNDSTLAYQAGARHLGFEQVHTLCELACNHIQPQCTLLLDLDPKVGLQRRAGRVEDRMEQEGLAFQYEVRQNYLLLADKYPERIVIIDATQPLDEVIQSASSALMHRIGSLK